MTPEFHRLVYTRGDGGVNICQPSTRIWRAITGVGMRAVDEFSPWAAPSMAFIRTQIARMESVGMDGGAARRSALAMMRGGLSESEAWNLFMRRERHRGSGHEVWHVSDIPADRSYRDAWRRAPWGGLIWIDLEAAREIQARRILETVERWNAAADRAETLALLAGRQTNGPATIALDVRVIGRRIGAARTIEEINAAWPEDLPAPVQKRSVAA